MKKIKNYVIAVIIISLLVFVKAAFFPSLKTKENRSDKKEKKPVPVSVFIVGYDKIQNKVLCNGKILANEEVELRTEASGKISYLNLPEGKFVKAGTLLVKLNAQEQQTQLEKIEAQLILARTTVSRRRELLETHSVSKEEYENAVSTHAALKADSALIQAQIAKKIIHAPFDGVIGIRNVSIGSYITPDIITAVIHQVDPVKVEFSLPERYAPLFRVGDEIDFRTEGSNTLYKGKIVVQDPAVDLASGNVRYHAWSKNSKDELLPGSFAQIELLLKEDKGSVFVPTEAIVPVAKGKKVFVVQNGVAKERIVTMGVRTENYLQILSGIEPGDSVVVKGNFQLKDDVAVKTGKKKKDK
ncbi:MAG: yegM [Chitinophagaceae bacterium]|nr:yegM [Chitinophagaceae bacterium]